MPVARISSHSGSHAMPARRMRRKTSETSEPAAPAPPAPLTDPCLAARCGLHDDTLERLMRFQVPTAVLQVLACLQTLAPADSEHRDIDCIEYFCGVKSITDAFNNAGLFAVASWNQVKSKSVLG